MVVETIKELKLRIQEQKQQNKTIGFVPTMGSLHEGHLSLIKRAKKENDFVIVSVFVNPTQFAPNEDFAKYPRDIDRDEQLANSVGADLIFHPAVDEMYIPGASTYVEVEGNLTKKLCGSSRPTHFKGVTTVVTLLFHIVSPDAAYFGQKDAQQAAIIQKMVRDLHMEVNVVICPIVREEDGLALSSRNIYLNQEERKQALILYQTLKEVKKLCLNNPNVSELKTFMKKKINTMPLAMIDYVEILDADTLEEIETIDRSALAAVAVKFGKTRLIDNMRLERT